MATCRFGNYQFQWTELHLPREETDPLRYEYDELGSEVVEKLQEISRQKQQEDGTNRARTDLYALLKNNHNNDETLTKFWETSLMEFALQGFMGENSAASGVVEVLFILQATKSLEAIKPGGEGHISTVRVRLLHSSVRKRIMKLAKSRPDYFDVEKFGVPVKQAGLDPFHHDAKAVMESMLIHELHVTPTSRIVGHNFVECLKDLPPVNISAQFIEAGSRVLNGDELCDSLGLGRPGWYSYACFKGHCWLVQVLALAQHSIPSLDHTITEFWKDLLHEAVIQSKGGLNGGSKFDFKAFEGPGALQTSGRNPEGV
ncbi:transcriptional regulator [Diaporthe eres]|nr:transcriptional regulator [Diaporthe eres]